MRWFWGEGVLESISMSIKSLHDGSSPASYGQLLTPPNPQENNSAYPKRAGPKNPPNSSSACSRTQKPTPTPKDSIPAI